MSDALTTNQKSFIAISEERCRLDNSLNVMESMAKSVSRMDQWSKQYMGDLKTDIAFTAEVESWMKVIPYLCDDGSKIKTKIEQTRARINELKNLQEVFLKGGDIVQAKLSK